MNRYHERFGILEDMRILVVEDNEKIAKYIAEVLEHEGYAVDHVTDGETGERRALSGWYDLVLLDVMLPEKDGVSVCKSLRAAQVFIPIIMVTAKGELDDKIIGLDSGADDYIVKPFQIEELLARIRALLRRPAEHVGESLTTQDLTLDTQEHAVMRGTEKIELTRKEYAILEYLMRNKNIVITREQILDHCWDFSFETFSNIVDVYIKQLRKKLDTDSEKYIKTIRGVGYKLKG